MAISTQKAHALVQNLPSSQVYPGKSLTNAFDAAEVELDVIAELLYRPYMGNDPWLPMWRSRAVPSVSVPSYIFHVVELPPSEVKLH